MNAVATSRRDPARAAGPSAVDRAPSLPQLLSELSDRLAAAGVPSPRHDAEELAAYVLGVRRGALAAAGDLDAGSVTRLTALIGRRAAREPLQHLTGRAGFRRLDLAVGPGVFVPRPETESLVEWCLAALGPARADASPMVVDLCAGSGAIALALAQELPGAVELHAVESADDAYCWLARNAGERRAAGDPAVSVHHGDAERALPELTGSVDLVVSNAPYLVDGTPLPLEVSRHDPGVALWGGPDGLAVVRQVERAARRLLRPGGVLAVEHADDQGDALDALLRGAGWTDVDDHRDLASRPRFATARKPAHAVSPLPPEAAEA